ncbi:MAG: glycoside hydrolase family 3 C-terminal domain-containing protein [Eubacteriales bacterium]
MTMEEKLSQMVYQSPAIERLGIPSYNWWNESLHGVARAGVSTMFPQAIGLSATFDKDLLKGIAEIIAIEGRAKYGAYSRKGDRGIYKGLTYWAPNINIFRDPRWGRGHETFGEDPYLAATLGVSYVEGLQGNDREHLKATACAKHFAVHSGPEGLRHEFDAVVSTKDMYDTYLYAFKRLVKDGKVEAIMGAYNRVNGEPACGSKTLLKDILRDEWQFKGHVVSDCWAINDFHEHHMVTKTVVESAALAVNNGCDLNCGSAYLHLPKAFEEGLVSEETINASVTRLLDTRIRLGMLEDYPSPYDNVAYEMVECKEHVEVAIEAGRRTVVMLKNDGILPLNLEKINTIAVIGPNADSRDGLIGNYTGTSSEYVTPLEGIRRAVGDEARVVYAQGAHLFKGKVEVLAEEDDRIAEALCVAEMSDVVIMCLGLDATIEGEQGDTGNAYASGDKIDLSLPGLQQQLLEEVTKIGKPVILLLSTGSAMDLSFADKNIAGILQTWYPGARGGIAIADLLLGKASPSGKLPVTFYKSVDDLPEFTDYSMKNRTYRFMENEALYPFGFGLQYGKVVYSNSGIDCMKHDVLDNTEVRTEVKNNSQYQMNEIVQVYISRKEGNQEDAFYQLKNVEVVALESGESKTVKLTLHPRDFATITENGKAIVEPGKYKVFIGGQQPDSRSEKLTGMKVDCFEVELLGEILEVEY